MVQPSGLQPRRQRRPCTPDRRGDQVGVEPGLVRRGARSPRGRGATPARRLTGAPAARPAPRPRGTPAPRSPCPARRRSSSASGFEQYGHARGQRCVSSASSPRAREGAGGLRHVIGHRTSIRFATSSASMAVDVGRDHRRRCGVTRRRARRRSGPRARAVAAAQISRAGPSVSITRSGRAAPRRRAPVVEMQAHARRERGRA